MRALIHARTSCSNTRDNNLLAVGEDNVQRVRSMTGAIAIDRKVILKGDMGSNRGMVELLNSAEQIKTDDPC